ncbi:MAG: divergent PAP2 family protein [Candidatus Omnitrophica bacterium]|nr:divergent PAP2 family protein [Candidatus Omnitrophota bacterium]
MGTTKNLIITLAGNKIFWITLSTWMITQTIKVIIGVIREKRFDFRWFGGTGGMPSSHAATVSALSTSVGLCFGIDSALFIVTLVFSIIVIFDAQGVRRATGKQAEILNKMLEDIYWRHRIQEDRLKELLGHAPIQVLVGIISGVALAFLLWFAMI